MANGFGHRVMAAACMSGIAVLDWKEVRASIAPITPAMEALPESIG
jgi:hypothetical protein